ncbi:MAG: secretin N-terminal domain-containing protein [Lentisphaeria bacterium]|jgi:general secretion pathway protein D
MKRFLSLPAALLTLALLAAPSCQTPAPAAAPPPAAAASRPPPARPAAAPEPAGDPLVTDLVAAPQLTAGRGAELALPAAAATAAAPAPAARPPFYEPYLGEKPDAPLPEPALLAFDAAPLADLVPAFAKILGFNYLLDPSLKGAVTMSVHANMSRRQLWQMFDRLLQLSGAYASPEGGVLHILPFSKLPQERRLLAAGAEPAANVTAALLPLRYASSKDVLEKLKPFLTEGATAIDLPGRNALLLVEPEANLARVRALLPLLDQRNKAGWPKAVIPCRNVSATRIRNELAALLPVLGFPVTTDPAGGEPGAIQLQILDRMQLLVAAAATEEALAEVKQWVAVLDRTDVGEQEALYIYKVMNGKADELLPMLQGMFVVESATVVAGSSTASAQGGGATTTATTQEPAGATPGRRTGTGGGTAARGETAGTAATARPPQPATATAATGAAGQAAPEAGPASVFEIPVKIVADSAQNRLLIRTVPRVYAMLNAFLSRLDTAPSQVLLEVVVSEVTLTESTQFGLEFSTKGTAHGSYTSIFGTNFAALAPGVTPPADLDSGLTYWVSDPLNPTQKFAYLRALAGTGKIEVISSPQVVVTSNTTATIQVGDKVPLVANEISDTASSPTPDSTSLRRTYQYEDTGIILKVTPRVTKGGLIALEIDQEVSDAVKTKSSNIDSPTIQKRRIETALALRDGSTLFVGGLIRSRKLDNLSSIPFLVKVPVLNRIFGYTEKEDTKTELVMMITGKIVHEESPLEGMLRRYKQTLDAYRNQGLEF